jgi:hypothetical protein
VRLNGSSENILFDHRPAFGCEGILVNASQIMNKRVSDRFILLGMTFRGNNLYPAVSGARVGLEEPAFDKCIIADAKSKPRGGHSSASFWRPNPRKPVKWTFGAQTGPELPLSLHLKRTLRLGQRPSIEGKVLPCVSSPRATRLASQEPARRFYRHLCPSQRLVLGSGSGIAWQTPVREDDA